MKQEDLNYKFVVEIKYTKDYKKQSALFNNVVRYLDLEFALNVKRKVENKKGMTLFLDDEFHEDKVADYLLGFVHPDNLTIIRNGE